MGGGYETSHGYWYYNFPMQISDGVPSILIKIADVCSAISLVCLYESTISTLLVAVYQFVSIRLDPFGARRFITTPRCVATCIGTWVVSFIFSCIDTYFNYGPIIGVTYMVVLITVSTLCYSLIYRGVSKTPCADSVQLRQRKADNMRILRTFGLVLGTSVACWIVPVAYQIIKANGQYHTCLEIGAHIMISFNVCTNSLIYWWRLKEFRSIFPDCRRRRVDPRDIVV